MTMTDVKKIIENSIILINKPPGQTSHEITTFVKKITGASRSGHAGTLDPNVSGVLPVALGRATKLLRYVAGKDKTYVGIIKFRHILARQEIEALFKEFTGELTQTPPKISAVRKVPRKRTVYTLRLLENKEHIALFETNVDAGTYIRTLCDDMGKKCGGARMEELRRTAVGRIHEKDTFTMQEVIDAMWLLKNKEDSSEIEKMLQPPEKFIDLQKVYLKESALKSVLNGAQIMIPAIEKIGEVERGERVAIYAGQVFIGVGQMQIAGREFNEKIKGEAIKLERVHAERM
ncbi:putative tRNA pseudouridine synthase B [Candidatus Bilamarchaeum dharawalense]|uniref:Putative tRNA pseudouridine synthase B n=1 Tax=Candidatus Bilamarchaeum dharawalense TaxID=2885759 RepID=A0A5E4LQ43_9ARCH|nr:putative tRNA pseudouridine synthase B [Candidatus Bilamarchaeum dharawalense]